eukprot:COSAG02_NODE_35701_length_464_cov_4.986301_1_plen_99_part_00
MSFRDRLGTVSPNDRFVCKRRDSRLRRLDRSQTSFANVRCNLVGGCWLVGEIGPVGGSVTPKPLRRGGWVGPGDSPQITSLHFFSVRFPYGFMESQHD